MFIKSRFSICTGNIASSHKITEVLEFHNLLEHGFSNCGTPTIVYWEALLIKKIEI
jgi:hypothetical protein